MSVLDEKVASGIRVFESWTQSQMAYSGQPGISVAVVKDQEVVWSRGFGYADEEEGIEATPESIYRIASISKLFTSTAIMQLRDQGKLSIHDKITDYLPWFKIDNQKGMPITIENLITHTSGLPREASGPYWTTVEFPTKEERIENLPTQEHPLKPWRKWKYSNLALSLAGYIVEETSGKSYEEYVKENPYKPFLPENAEPPVDLNKELMDEINHSGSIFITHTRLNDVFSLRLAVGQTQTGREHVVQAWDALQESRVVQDWRAESG